MLLFLWSVCVAQIFIVNFTDAAVIYVDVTGSVASSCSVTDPCPLATGLSSAKAGDIVQLSAAIHIGNFQISTPNVTVVGQGTLSVVQSMGNVDGSNRDVVFTVSAASVSINNLRVVHPPLAANANSANFSRIDIGVLVTANDFSMSYVHIQRYRTGERVGTTPPLQTYVSSVSSGIAIYGSFAKVRACIIAGPYMIAANLPCASASISGCSISDALGAGVVVPQLVQNVGDVGNSNNTFNSINGNVIQNIQGDCIQIQGDYNTVNSNQINQCNGNGIELCGPGSTTCFSTSSGVTAVSIGNTVTNNVIGSVVKLQAFANYGGPTNVFAAGLATQVPQATPLLSFSSDAATQKPMTASWIIIALHVLYLITLLFL